MRRLLDATAVLVGLGLLAFLALVSLPELLGGADGAEPARATAPARATVPTRADAPAEYPAEGAAGAADAATGASPGASPGAEPAELRCGPCAMTMPAESELVEIAGRRWAVCSERCAELIAADPERFAADAVVRD